MRNNKKVVLYAGALLTVAIFVCSSIAISEPTTTSEDGCNRIYDVNRDGNINFQDAGLCFVYYYSEIDNEYGNLLYDVNFDGIVDESDALEIWEHRD